MFAEIGGEMRAPTWAIPLVRWIIRRYADQLVANSMATARNLLGEGPGEVDVVPNAVRSSFFTEERTQTEARAELGLTRDAPLIGVPGTLRPMKGHPFFFDAVAPLLRRRDKLQVVVTGEGSSDFTQRLKKQVLNLDIQDRVEFLGWIDDMPAFYRACDLVCIPSRAEPFGRTVIEAFAVGTPVVASAVGGLKEIVTDEETGLLVVYGSRETLADAISRLLDSRDLCQRMGRSARQTAEEEYLERVYKGRIRALMEDTLIQNSAS
jgi:glycosyltransferase involved in cell wall biosynthesis